MSLWLLTADSCSVLFKLRLLCGSYYARSSSGRESLDMNNNFPIILPSFRCSLILNPTSFPDVSSFVHNNDSIIAVEVMGLALINPVAPARGSRHAQISHSRAC